MKVIGVIPARYGSTRFPGKPLAPILGKPLLQWVIEGARSCRCLNEVVVATDDRRIADLAESCGVSTEMTDSECPSGSDRVWQAVSHRGADVVVNIQGDEPLITGALLDQLVEPFKQQANLAMATLARSLQPGDLSSRQTAKIVLDKDGFAIYFSRLPIPYSRVDAPDQNAVVYKHIGLYAYRKSFLQQFCAQPPVALELAEGLEQLRALYLGAKIFVVPVEHESWGVDTPEDVQKIERLLHLRKQT